MFANLDFRMANSNGMTTRVVMENSEGIITYEVTYPDNGIDRCPKSVLGEGKTITLLNRLKEISFRDLVNKYVELEIREPGDYWSLAFDFGLGMFCLSGPELRSSVLGPLVEDFAEILDDVLGDTCFIAPHRIDSLDIVFRTDDLPPNLKQKFGDYDDPDRCDHIETITLNRKEQVVTIAKRHPAQCFNLLFESNCDNQIRELLDEFADYFGDDDMFHNILVEDDNVPRVHFCVDFHDGSKTHVVRSLCLEGLGDLKYIQIIERLSELVLQLLFKDGLFDKRHLFPDEDRMETPFFVVYSENEKALMEKLKSLGGKA